jgi:drug/metabolite transporter (DMT)-like permease
MFLIGIGIYTLIMVIVWGFFLVAKIHIFKFKEYSPLVPPMTKFLALLLIILTVLGYYFLYKMDGTTAPNTQTVSDTTTREIY